MSIKHLVEFVEKEISENLDLKKESPSDDFFPVTSLVEMIDKEIGRLSLLMEEVDESGNLDIDAAWHSIPLPTLSELGWADPRKKKGKIANETRSEMSNYLSNITEGANTLEERIGLIQQFMDNAAETAKDMNLSEVLSFLVFYKTLTYIISDFNKATAGFLFEALLGVLTGGQQIPAKGSGGGDTIADFKYKTGAKGQGTLRYVSLKLLTEGGTTIDGSFSDLINDLSKTGSMQYVVVLKDLEGKGEKTQGQLKFWQFIFDRSSILRLLGRSTDGRRCLQIANKASRAMLDGGAQHHTQLKWVEYIDQDHIKAALQGHGNSYSIDQKLKGVGRISLEDAKKIDLENGVPLKNIHQINNYSKMHPEDFDPESRHNFPAKTYEYLAREWRQWNQNADTESVAMKKVVGRINAKKNNTSKFRFLSFDQSQKLLEGLDGKEFWDFIKRYSNGYLNTKRFLLTQDQMIMDEGTTDVGTLSVGREKVRGALLAIITDVNQQMFKIFRTMGTLSTTLRQFFMEEMNAEKGKAAKKAAQQVYEETQELITKRGTVRKSSSKGRK